VRSDTPSFARPLTREQLDGEAKAIGERLCTSQYVHEHDDDDCLLSKPYEWQPLQNSYQCRRWLGLKESKESSPRIQGVFHLQIFDRIPLDGTLCFLDEAGFFFFF
jgi:hypothetical protein